jgi:hypothetical protein
MAVKIPLSLTTHVDGFIDDLICVFLDSGDNQACAPNAVPLAMNMTNHPDSMEPIKCRNILLLSKLKAKGTPDECQLVLGWMLDMHLLLVELPVEKFKAWLADVLQFLRKQGCSQEELDTLIIRLDHTVAIMPMYWHFLGCIAT